MDFEEHDPNDPGKEIPHLNQGVHRTSRDEKSASYIKPIIKELVRTQVCFPDIKLLVDKISRVKVPSATESSGLEAYCLYLTDREKTIQAVVRRRLHKWLTTFDVQEGSYVVLKTYGLAKGKRLHGKGDVFYLAISDFYSIGGEQRYSTSTDLKSVSTGAEGTPSLLDQGSAIDDDELEEVELIRTECSLPRDSIAREPGEAVNEVRSLSTNPEMGEPNPKKRDRGTPLLDLDPDLLPPDSKHTKLRGSPSLEMTRGNEPENTQKKPSKDEFQNGSALSMVLSAQESAQARLSPERVPSPLHLSTLASVTGIHATRNKQVNILAMIASVSTSTVKPATLPLKRDVRIVDPSTDKRVTLSVFVDPVNFIPEVYDIILFRDLTTHEYGGGSLNVYPTKCKGKEWFILNPYDIEECNMESMEIFRAEYRKRTIQVLEKQITRIQ